MVPEDKKTDSAAQPVPVNPEEGGHPEMVSALLRDALQARATDAHIDTEAEGIRICFRVDGVIQRDQQLSPEQGRHLLNQIKVAARMSPNRLQGPREGRLAWRRDGEPVDVRVTLTPTVSGEAAHLRLLSQRSAVLRPDELGLSESALDTIRKALRQPEGLALIAGPTGAGKTMTLYSLVSLLRVESVIAGSIEDPVEFDLPHVRQVQVDPDRGFTMAEGLRSMLRMDPDILLVGEIRGESSALTVVRAAASGRFVLATLHARDMALAIAACHLYGVPPHLLGTTLRLVISQKLVRRVCPKCVGRRRPTAAERDLFTAENLPAPKQVPAIRGCPACRNFGYRGRTGVFEVVPTDETLRRAIAQNRPDHELRQILDRRGLGSLRQDALSKVRAGVTSVEEVMDLSLPGKLGEAG